MLRGFCSRGVPKTCDIVAQLEGAVAYNAALLRYKQNKDPSEMLPIARENCRLGNLQACTAATQLEGAVAANANRPRPAGAQASLQSDSNKSRVIAGNGQSAMGCVALVVRSSGDSRVSGGGRVLANNCSGPVEATWCYVDVECGRESGSAWTIGVGRSYPVSAEREIRWAACIGANTVSFEKGTAGTRFICTAPSGGPQPQAKLGAPLRSNQNVASSATSSGPAPTSVSRAQPMPPQGIEAAVLQRESGDPIWSACGSMVLKMLNEPSPTPDRMAAIRRSWSLDQSRADWSSDAAAQQEIERQRQFINQLSSPSAGNPQYRQAATLGAQTTICRLTALLANRLR